MTFNEKIDNYMQENNISNLKQLAKLSNIPYTTLRDFYDKKSADNSRLSTIRKLSQYMNCSMDYLAYDDITMSIIDNTQPDLHIDIGTNVETNERNFDELELLFDKARPHLSEDDKEMMKFLMQKTINNYEKSKKQGGE